MTFRNIRQGIIFRLASLGVKNPFSMKLTEKLDQYQHEYVIVIEDVQKALEIQDLDFRVAVGELGDPQTYRRLKVEDAALVVANVEDMMNTNIAFTIREISQTVPIVSNADLDDSVDILELAGSTHVYQFTKMLGQSLARRVLGTSTKANIIGKIESLLIAEAPSVIITTHDDPTNIYLTIYCRRLCPDIQIISRANIERNISKLHTAGADMVMSYASMAATTILNLLKPDELLMLAEGLNIFRVVVPAAYVDKSLAESQIRSNTGCNVVAVCDRETMCINPEPTYRFSENNELILIGSEEAENRFFKMHAELKKIKAT